MNWFEKWLLLVVGGFIGGIPVASVSQAVVDQVDSTINLFMSLYDYVAPAAIFLILSPSLARMFSSRKTGKFGILIMNWFALRNILASLWAMYAAVAASLISIKVERLTRLLEKIMDTVEMLGGYLLPIMPGFMFGIGAYIYGLPDDVQEQVGLDANGKSVLLDLNIWGWVTSPRTPAGMITSMLWAPY